MHEGDLYRLTRPVHYLHEGAPEAYVYGANQRSDIKFFFLVSLPLKRGTTLLPMRDT